MSLFLNPPTPFLTPHTIGAPRVGLTRLLVSPAHLIQQFHPHTATVTDLASVYTDNCMTRAYPKRDRTPLVREGAPSPEEDYSLHDMACDVLPLYRLKSL